MLQYDSSKFCIWARSITNSLSTPIWYFQWFHNMAFFSLLCSDLNNVQLCSIDKCQQKKLISVCEKWLLNISLRRDTFITCSLPHFCNRSNEHFVRKYWKIGYSNVSRFLLCVHVCECTLVHCTLRRFYSIIWWKWHTEVFPLIFCRSEEVRKLWLCLSQRDVQ